MAHRRKPLGVALALMTGVPVRVGAQVGRRLLAVPGARSVATPVRRAGAVRAVHEAARRASAASSEALWTPSTKETQAAGHGAGAELHREHGRVVHQFVSWNSDEQRVTRRVNSADDERGGEKEDAGAV